MATEAVEELLRLDPADAYGAMDQASRDSYLSVIAALAEKSGAEEKAVAAACLELARKGALAKGASAPEAHVGHYLAGEGVGSLYRAVMENNGGGSARGPGLLFRLRCLPARLRFRLYLGTILLLAVAFTAGTALPVHAGGARGGFFLAVAALLALASFQLSIRLVDCIVRRLVPPAFIPKLDFSAGVPPQCRTLVVIPAVLADENGAERLLRNIERQFLNNRGENIHFALLTSFDSAPASRAQEDARLLNPLRLGILGLNRTYRGDGDGDFFLFHRPRAGNETEKLRGGHGRERGALEDLNRYLSGEDLDAFSRIEGAAHRLSGVRYVIVPGDGALLARGAAAAMAGAMAHPLNRPRYDPWTGRVLDGHGALRPRVRATLSGANRSLYALLSAHEPGVAAHPQPLADARQDLLGESPFDSGGGGIYDVAVCQRALGGRLSACAIPGHALLAGGVLRAGLLSDAVVYADPPADCAADSEQRRRRARADWRMLSCFVRPDGKALGPVGKWWIADRLGRNLGALSALLLISLALTSGQGYVPAAYAVPACCLFLSRQRWSCSESVLRQAARALFTLARLPHAACVNAGLGGVGMWICPLVAALLGAAAALRNPAVLPYALPLFLLWLIAPFCADRLSRPRRPRREALSGEDIRFLRHIARRSWLFFEDFAGGEENRLPPDSQPESADGGAGRCASPAGMGLSLLACLSARDFGYATQGEMLRRCEKTLDAMRALERRGSLFYSGYDARTARVRPGAAVSAAGNGVLAAHLLVLAQGLREMTGAPVIAACVWGGLLDAVQLARAEAENAAPRVLSGCFDLERAVSRLHAAPPRTPDACHVQLAALEKNATALEAAWGESGRWLRVFIAQCQSALGELGALVPWAAEMAANPDWTVFAELAAVPSLLDLVNMAPRMAAGEADGGAPEVPPQLLDLVQQAGVRAGHRLAVAQKLLSQCEGLADMDLSPLADERCGSSALPAAYLAVARDELPPEQWFTLIAAAGERTLSPAPLLVMPVFEGSLLDVVGRSSGVPEIGLRREPEGELVIEPHATALAAMFRPGQAARNLRLMASCGFLGAHGFYASACFTPRSGRYSVVRSFSAARQGMTLVALGQALLGRPMHRRFLANPVLNAASMLLQEVPAIRRAGGASPAAAPEAAREAPGVRSPEELAVPAGALPS